MRPRPARVPGLGVALSASYREAKSQISRRGARVLGSEQGYARYNAAIAVPRGVAALFRSKLKAGA